MNTRNPSMKPKTLHIVGACLDLGAGRRGVDMGPSALRLAGLNRRMESLGHRVLDAGNIPAPQAESGHFGDPKAKYLAEISAFTRKLHTSTRKALAKGHLPLVLGGDHTVAIGSIGGAAAHFNARGQKIGVLWLDAHTDMNTPETSPSGNIHGMPMATLLGRGPKSLLDIGGSKARLDPKKVAQIGIRSVDRKERELVKKLGVYVATMRDIDERGVKAIMEEALSRIGEDTAGIWVSLDMDGCDPRIAPGVGTPVMGGLTYREAHLILEIISDSGRLLGMDIVEINPILDESNATARFAVELAESALGKKII